jgi:hypothetical protein
LNKIISYFGVAPFKYNINIIMTLFGLFLVYAGIKSWSSSDADDDEDYNIKIVPKSGLDKTIIKSLILDLFNFDLEDFETKVGGYDLIQDILDPTGEKPYLIQDRLEDVIVF